MACASRLFCGHICFPGIWDGCLTFAFSSTCYFSYGYLWSTYYVLGCIIGREGQARPLPEELTWGTGDKKTTGVIRVLEEALDSEAC